MKKKRSANVLSKNHIKQQIFEIDLELSQTDNPEERKKLEALKTVYQDKLREKAKRKRILSLVTAPFLILLLIVIYLVTQFQSDSQKTQNTWATSSSKTSASESSSASSSSSTTSSSSSSTTSKTVVPSNIVGTWSGNVSSAQVTLTIESDGSITKSQDGYITNGQITGYEQVGNNLYRLDFVGDNASPLIFSGIGGVDVKYASGIYVDGNVLYPQLWSASSTGNFAYTISTTIALRKGTSTTASVDTKNLTEDQVQSWVLAVYASQNGLSNSDKSNYFVNVKIYDDSLVYASVRSNEKPNERIALYRVNSNGELEQGTLDATDWKVVSTAYYD